MSHRDGNESVLVPNSQPEPLSDTLRVVGTLTTMPDKYRFLTKTLDSLLAQSYRLDAIYLGLPKVSRRLGIPYPKLPKEIAKKCTVVEVEDYGPITKLLGALTREKDPNTVLISFDDDRYYPPTMVEKLMKHHRDHPRSAIGSSGMLLAGLCPNCAIYPNEHDLLYRIPKFHVPFSGRKVDSIYGYPGALYVRRMFPSVETLEQELLHYALESKEMLMNDDITISGYLSLQRIERMIFPDLPEVKHTIPDGMNKRVHGKDEISYNLDYFFQRMNACIRKCKDHGMFAQPEHISGTETVLGVGLILVLVILAVIGLLIYFLFFWRAPRAIF